VLRRRVEGEGGVWPSGPRSIELFDEETDIEVPPTVWPVIDGEGDRKPVDSRAGE